MKAVIGDTTYLVKWTHDREDKVTACFVRTLHGADKPRLCCGLTILNGENFCYNKARKRSLEKALHKLFPNRKLNDGLNNRTMFWSCYFAMRGGKW